jgi:hypothetical protein
MEQPESAAMLSMDRAQNAFFKPFMTDPFPFAPPSRTFLRGKFILVAKYQCRGYQKKLLFGLLVRIKFQAQVAADRFKSVIVRADVDRSGSVKNVLRVLAGYAHFVGKILCGKVLFLYGVPEKNPGFLSERKSQNGVTFPGFRGSGNRQVLIYEGAVDMALSFFGKYFERFFHGTGFAGKLKVSNRISAA